MNDQSARIVVVGSGLGGLQVAERLRARGYPGSLTLLGAEDTAPYDRPPLSKEVLRGDPVSIELRTAEHLRGLNAELRLGERAEALDLHDRVVHTASGEHAFDTLIIATGAVARRIPGLDGHVLRTQRDADTLRSALVTSRRVAVVGAGLIGCEVAASARALGIDVDLYDVLAGPMIRVVGATTSAVVADLHRDHGVRLHTSVTVARNEQRVLCVDGVPIEADLVVEAVGAVPDVGWLVGSDLNLANGVVCDENGRAAEGVYAVGDVACWAGRRSEHWTSAGHQADHVAATITGQELPEAQPAYWWSDQHGLRIQGLGTPATDDTAHLVAWGPHQRTVALYSRQGRLTGAVGFSAPGAVMRLSRDILEGSAIEEILQRLTAPRPARTA